jgi:hypothetical protein
MHIVHLWDIHVRSFLEQSDYDFFPAAQAEIFWENDKRVIGSGTDNINEEEFLDYNGVNHTISTKRVYIQNIPVKNSWLVSSGT